MSAVVEERRFRRLQVTPRLLVDMCKVGGVRRFGVVEGLPEDAQTYETHYDEMRNIFYFIIGSMEYEPVPFGNLLPEAVVTLRAVNE